jgi:hypothetical protein
LNNDPPAGDKPEARERVGSIFNDSTLARAAIAFGQNVAAYFLSAAA